MINSSIWQPWVAHNPSSRFDPALFPLLCLCLTPPHGLLSSPYLPVYYIYSIHLSGFPFPICFFPLGPVRNGHMLCRNFPFIFILQLSIYNIKFDTFSASFLFLNVCLLFHFATCCTHGPARPLACKTSPV